MKKDIYIIRNVINNKCYVGQSIDYKYRFRKHCEEAQRNKYKYKSYLYNAMNEIGIENFYVELLESQVEDYNEKEIYYINKYNTLRPNGYNLAKGGNQYPNLSGVEHHEAKITSQEDLNAIYDKLLNSDYTISEIAKQFNVSYDVISGINRGVTYKNDEYIYPLRKTILSRNEVDLILYDLKNSSNSYEEIANKYNISTNQVKAINSGRCWHKDFYPYPARAIVFNGDKEMCEMIKFDLINSDYSFDELTQIYKCSPQTIWRINKGLTHFDNKLKYPLRKLGKLSRQEVLNIHNELKNTQKDYIELGKEYNVSDATIKRINKGTIKKYIIDDYNYPIRNYTL